MSADTNPRPRLASLGRNPASAERFHDAERHRKRVARLRVYLPLAAIVCIAAVFVSLVMNARDDVHVAEGTAPGIEMTAPVLKGTDANGRPYEVKATQAVQNRDGLVELTDITMRMELEDGTLNLVAQRGTIQPETGIASADGGVKIDLDGKQHFMTEHADAELKAGRVTGNQPVRVEGPNGTIDAKGFIIEKSVKRVTFLGGITSVVNPNVPPAEDKPAP